MSRTLPDQSAICSRICIYFFQCCRLCWRVEELLCGIFLPGYWTVIKLLLSVRQNAISLPPIFLDSVYLSLYPPKIGIYSPAYAEFRRGTTSSSLFFPSSTYVSAFLTSSSSSSILIKIYAGDRDHFVEPLYKAPLGMRFCWNRKTLPTIVRLRRYKFHHRSVYGILRAHS